MSLLRCFIRIGNSSNIARSSLQCLSINNGNNYFYSKRFLRTGKEPSHITPGKTPKFMTAEQAVSVVKSGK